MARKRSPSFKASADAGWSSSAADATHVLPPQDEESAP